MDDTTTPAPCACLPDSLIAAVAEVAAKTGRGFDEALCAILLVGIEAIHEHSWAESSQLIKAMQLFMAEYHPNGEGVAETEAPPPVTPPLEDGEQKEFDHSQQVFTVGQSVTAGGHSGKILTAGKDEDDRWQYQVQFPHGVGRFLGDEIRGA